MRSLDCFKLDEMIKDGRGLEARCRLERVSLKRVPSSQSTQVAYLMCRVGLAEKVFKFFHPFIRNSELVKPSEDIKVVYAFALLQMNLIQEAMNLVDKIDANRFPLVSFIRGLGFVRQWDYDSAYGHFRNYVASSSIDRYQNKVGRLNLISCLTSLDKLDLALDEVESLIFEAKNESLNLILGNALELKSQILIEQNRYDEAIEFLGLSSSLLKMSNEKFDLFADKWKFRAYVESDQVDAGEAKKRYNAVRVKAEKLRHYETLRSLDFLYAKEIKFWPMLAKNYYLSPFIAYKNRVSSVKGFDIPNYYIEGSNIKFTFDIKTGVLESKGHKVALSKSSVNYHLLLALCSDGYRPFSVERLHSSAFDGEYFNPFSSINRIHQGLSRLKKMVQGEFGVELNLFNGDNYRIDFDQIAVRYSDACLVKSEIEARSQLILKSFKGQPSFTIADVANILDISKRTAQRTLKADHLKTQIQVIGSGSSTKYKVVA